jgi:hypothetical protein
MRTVYPSNKKESTDNGFEFDGGCKAIYFLKIA